MATIKPRSLVIVLVALALSLLGVPSHAATRLMQGAPEPARAPTIKETMAQVGRIAEELKQIDGRLQHLEKSIAGLEASVAGIDKSMGPVGNALKAEAIREVVNEAGDVAFDRARSLILLGTFCLAALIVLHAFLRRWRLTAARATEQKGD